MLFLLCPLIFYFHGPCPRDLVRKARKQFRVCYDAEKHGKGFIDSMFGGFEPWVASYLKIPQRVIKTDADLMEVATRAAEKMSSEQPNSFEFATWSVARYDSELKPAEQWILEDVGFSITKSYSFQFEAPGRTWDRAKPQIRNFICSDFASNAGGGALHYPGFASKPIEDRNW